MLFRLLLDAKAETFKIIIGIITCYLSVNIVIWPLLGVSAVNNTQEISNALKFQQTSRYINKHSDTITSEEKKIIDDVLCYEDIGNYDPYLADPIMGTYHASSNKELKEFNKLWLQYMRNDFQTYVAAWLQYTYLYIYPFDTEHFANAYDGKFQISHQYVNTGYFDIQRSKMRNHLTDILINIHSILIKNSVTKIIYSAGTYGWILLICVGYALYSKKYIYLLVFSPAIVNLIICVSGFMPVNGSLRYSLPVIMMVPYMVGIVFGRCLVY